MTLMFSTEQALVENHGHISGACLLDLFLTHLAPSVKFIRVEGLDLNRSDGLDDRVL